MRSENSDFPFRFLHGKRNGFVVYGLWKNCFGKVVGVGQVFGVVRWDPLPDTTWLGQFSLTEGPGVGPKKSGQPNVIKRKTKTGEPANHPQPNAHLLSHLDGICLFHAIPCYFSSSLSTRQKKKQHFTVRFRRVPRVHTQLNKSHPVPHLSFDNPRLWEAGRAPARNTEKLCPIIFVSPSLCLSHVSNIGFSQWKNTGQHLLGVFLNHPNFIHISHHPFHGASSFQPTIRKCVKCRKLNSHSRISRDQSENFHFQTLQGTSFSEPPLLRQGTRNTPSFLGECFDPSLSPLPHRKVQRAHHQLAAHQILLTQVWAAKSSRFNVFFCHFNRAFINIQDKSSQFFTPRFFCFVLMKKTAINVYLYMPSTIDFQRTCHAQTLKLQLKLRLLRAGGSRADGCKWRDVGPLYKWPYKRVSLGFFHA